MLTNPLFDRPKTPCACKKRTDDENTDDRGDADSNSESEKRKTVNALWTRLTRISGDVSTSKTKTVGSAVETLFEEVALAVCEGGVGTPSKV